MARARCTSPPPPRARKQPRLAASKTDISVETRGHRATWCRLTRRYQSDCAIHTGARITPTRTQTTCKLMQSCISLPMRSRRPYWYTCLAQLPVAWETVYAYKSTRRVRPAYVAHALHFPELLSHPKGLLALARTTEQHRCHQQMASYVYLRRYNGASNYCLSWRSGIAVRRSRDGYASAIVSASSTDFAITARRAVPGDNQGKLVIPSPTLRPTLLERATMAT